MVDDQDRKKTHLSFTKDICIKRVEKLNKLNLKFDEIENTFGEFSFSEIEERLVKKHPLSINRKHFKELKKILKSQKYDEGDINIIISNLSYTKSYLSEKKNIYLFFQKWAKSEALVEASKKIKQSQKIHIEGNNTAGEYLHGTSTLKHIEDDLKYQILTSDHQQILYCGFDTIVKITQSNPRGFVNIMKHAYEHADFAEEKVFSEPPLSCKVQNRAVREASERFWLDAISDIKDLQAVVLIERLCELFKSLRLTNKPTEKSLISFAHKPAHGSTPEFQRLIEIAKDHSLLIKDPDGKKAKNSRGSMLEKYQINPMLSPKWDLPIDVGGTIELSSHDLDSICDKKSDDPWLTFKKEIISRHSAPFNKTPLANAPELGKHTKPQQEELF